MTRETRTAGLVFWTIGFFVVPSRLRSYPKARSMPSMPTYTRNCLPGFSMRRETVTAPVAGYPVRVEVDNPGDNDTLELRLHPVGGGPELTEIVKLDSVRDKTAVVRRSRGTERRRASLAHALARLDQAPRFVAPPGQGRGLRRPAPHGGSRWLARPDSEGAAPKTPSRFLPDRQDAREGQAAAASRIGERCRYPGDQGDVLSLPGVR